MVALVLAGILVAAGLVGGGWWLGRRGKQPVVSGVITAPPSGQPTTPHRPSGDTDDPCGGRGLAAAAGHPAPAVLLARGRLDRQRDEGNLEGGSDVVWTGSEALPAGLINGATALPPTAGGGSPPAGWAARPSPSGPVGRC